MKIGKKKLKAKLESHIAHAIERKRERDLQIWSMVKPTFKAA